MEQQRLVTYRPMIRDIPMSERPWERLRGPGARLLSSAELLAILLRVGVRSESAVAMATRILYDFQSVEALARVFRDDLCSIKGLGEAKVAQVLAALEFGRRIAIATPDDRVAPRVSGTFFTLIWRSWPRSLSGFFCSRPGTRPYRWSRFIGALWTNPRCVWPKCFVRQFGPTPL